MAVNIHKISTPFIDDFAKFIGFYTAHMVWSLDASANVPPMLAIQKSNQAWIERFSGDSYEQVANKAKEKFENLSLDKGDYIFIAYDGFLVDGAKREETLFISAFENQDSARTACLLTISYRSACSSADLAIKQTNIFLPNNVSGLEKDQFLKKGQEGVYIHTKGFEFWTKHWDSQSEPIRIIETANQNQLCGTWIRDPEDVTTLRRFKNVKQYFKENGQLIYFVLDEKQTIYLLTYRIENNVLITDQPSCPREERAHFILTREGKLVLDDLVEGVPSRYIRIRFPEHLLFKDDF